MLSATAAAAQVRQDVAAALEQAAKDATTSRVGAVLIDAAVPRSTKATDASAWKTWTTFRELRGEQTKFDATTPTSTVDGVLCTFLLSVYGAMKPRSRSSALPKPSSAHAVVEAVRRKHGRDHFQLAATPRV